MHIPDGFLDARTALAAAGLSTAGVGVALRSARRTLPPSHVPLIGVAAAFVFAAQMLNFPVTGGTSGHLLGAVLVAVLLGPGAAILTMTTVLLLQCFLFADGGITALGANLFNMALVAPTVGYTVYRLAALALGDTVRARLAGTALGAGVSTLLAAAVCAGELALSGTVPWRTVAPAMLWVHAPIAAGEALFTTLVVAAVARARPELWARGAARVGGAGATGVATGGVRAGAMGCGAGALAGYGAVVSLGLAIFVAPFACPWPDGLERVAASLGFASRTPPSPAVASPLHGYAVPGVPWPLLSTMTVGVLGVSAAFLLAWLLARRLTPGTAPPRAAARSPERP